MFSNNYMNAVKNGNAYSISNVDYDYAAADTVLWLANTHTGGWKAVVEGVMVSSDTATVYTIHAPTYASPAGTAVTAVNQNSDSSNTAICEAYADETNNSAGTAIAGGHLLASDTQFIPLNYRLGYQKAIGVDFVDEGTGGVCTIFFYFEKVA